jgi:phage terminase Nu1 subunit (DNA packaging protein)
MPKVKPKSQGRVLKGWTEIAEFLGQTVSVAQHWQRSGMPVTREGRFVSASPEELTAWVHGTWKK